MRPLKDRGRPWTLRDVGSSYDYEKTVGEGVYGEVLLSASRRVEAPSRHRRASSPGEDVVAGFFFDFEAIRTESSDRDAPRRCFKRRKNTRGTRGP